MPIKLIKTPSQLFFMNSILFFNKVTNIFLEDSLTKVINMRQLYLKAVFVVMFLIDFFGCFSLRIRCNTAGKIVPSAICNPSGKNVLSAIRKSAQTMVETLNLQGKQKSILFHQIYIIASCLFPTGLLKLAFFPAKVAFFPQK